jgi:cell division protein ZapE
MTDGPYDAYRKLVADGDLRPDEGQETAARHLQTLHDVLKRYAPQVGRKGWAARLGLAGAAVPPPRGLYLYGGVGRGKSMLMDLFHRSLGLEGARRVHFHAFMQEVHERLHRFREAAKAGKVSAARDPIKALAKVIAERAWLLCFDELQVTDIGDAMILGRLFEALFEQGVVVVATSNRPPDDLYKDGLQRGQFLPFIALIKLRMEMLPMDGGVDHRLQTMRTQGVYVSPLDASTEAHTEATFARLTSHAEVGPDTLTIHGRKWDIGRVADGVAFVTFAELCSRALGPADFLAIAERYHTLVLAGVPRLGPSNRDEAKRFVTLVDALYEAKTKLICSADAPPQELYTKGDGAFEFQRTVSRLIEMQSETYLALPHVVAKPG